MINIVDAWISVMRKWVDLLDETCNFCVPWIVKHIEKKKNNWELVVKTYEIDDSEDKLQITSKNCRWYIWKIFKNKDNIYSKENFWIGSLWYLFKKLKESEKLTIVIAPSLSKYMNGAEDLEWAMNVEEEKKLYNVTCI